MKKETKSPDGIHKKKNFTLVELLIVVAVIAILAGMLLPALNSALETSKKSSCMNNYKQLLLGVRSYSFDYNDIFPASLPAGMTVTGTVMHWPNFLWKEDNSGSYVGWKSLVCPSLQIHPDKNIWYCNGMLGYLGNVTTFAQNNYGKSSYLYTSSPRISLINFKGMISASRFPIFSDTKRFGNDSKYPVTFYAPNQPNTDDAKHYSPSLHHRSTGMIGFADGHTASYGHSWYAKEGFGYVNIEGVHTRFQ